MVKQKKIDGLMSELVFEVLGATLRSRGYTSQKTKSRFVKKGGVLEHVVAVREAREALSFDEEKEILLLNFSVSFGVESPQHDKWYEEKTGDVTRSSARVSYLNVSRQVPLELFTQDDVYEATASQAFKNHVSRALSAGRPENSVPMEEFENRLFSEHLSALESVQTPEQMFAHRDFPLALTSLLIYADLAEQAEPQIELLKKYHLEQIQEEREKGGDTASYVKSYSEFLKAMKKLTGKDYGIPSSDAPVKVASQEKIFAFPGVAFHERLRLRITDLQIDTVVVSPRGEVLLFIDKERIVKLNPSGEVLLDHPLEAQPGFSALRWGVPVGYIPELDAFYVNNLIIDGDNNFTTLNLNVAGTKSKGPKDAHISDFFYDLQTDSFWVLYGGLFCVFSRSGEVTRTVPLVNGSGRRIIKNLRSILATKDKKTFRLLDENGSTRGEYDYGGGNEMATFSHNAENVVFHGYSTKSQFYSVSGDVKKVLWAHPTFVDGYVDTLYNDIYHNFGLNTLQFSPDDRLLVGGGDHGKYVAWTMPKLERHELIPSAEVIAKLRKFKVISFREAEPQDIVTEPEVISLDGKQFFKNRSNDISGLMFFEKCFVTEIAWSQLLIIWNYDLTCHSSVPVDGTIVLHNERFLSESTKDEITIFENRSKDHFNA